MQMNEVFNIYAHVSADCNWLLL